MSNPKLKLLWILMPIVALAIYLAVYQARLTNLQEASEPSHQVVDGSLTTVPRADALVPSTVVPGLPVSDPAELPPAALADDRQFIGRVFPLLSTWNLPEVKPLLSPATLEASSDAELSAVLATLKEQLGSLQHFDEPRPVKMAVQSVADGEEPALPHQALQQYQFRAYYDAGKADVNLILERLPETHTLYSFDINISP
ncbi:MAG: hypothetical protein RLZZ227_1984 [Pseudomonadota bacterium]|jgi:hypothetical protein